MNEFQLTEKQKEATSFLAGGQRHNLIMGGSRSGKSFCIVRAQFIRSCLVPSRRIALRSTFNSIKTSLWMDTARKVHSLCFPDLKLKWNKTDHFIEFPNGSEYWFAGLDDEKRVEKILGKEFSDMFFNEITQIPYSSVQIALTRLAEKNDLKKKAYYDMNPASISSWPYSLFIQKLNPVDNEPISNPFDYQSMRINPIDNLVNIDSDYINMLNSMPEREKQRFLLGEFQDDSDGQVYYAFNREKHVKEFETPKYGTLYIASDFNVSPTTSIIFKYENGIFKVFDEVYLEVGDTYKLANELKKRNYIGTLIPDSTGGNRRTSGISDHEILKQSGQTIPSVFNPAVIDRVNNINRLLSSDRIWIHPRCKKLINDLVKVTYKNGVPDQLGANKMLTHMSDCLGYGCWHLDKIGIKMNTVSVSKYR